MPDDYASHRRFHVYAVAGEGAGANDPGALTDAEAEKAVRAYVWPEFTEVRLFPRDDFEKYATPFEHAFSSLLERVRVGGAAPIVDESGEVIMYLGWFDYRYFRMPSDMLDAFQASDDWQLLGVYALSEQWKGQISISTTELGPGMSDPMQQIPEMRYLALTTIDGTVMQLLSRHDTVGDMSTFQPTDLLAPWIAGLIRGLGLAVLDYVLAEDTIVELGTSRLVGSVSAEEMEFHMNRIMNRPELRALRAIRNFQGDNLLRETLTSMKGWAQSYGKVVVEKSAEEMAQVTTSTNLITLQPPGIRSQLWINKELLSLSTAREFYEEGVHELTADALGWSGEAGPETLAFVGERFKETNNVQYLLEQVIQSGQPVRDVIDMFARLSR